MQLVLAKVENILNEIKEKDIKFIDLIDFLMKKGCYSFVETDNTIQADLLIDDTYEFRFYFKKDGVEGIRISSDCKIMKFVDALNSKRSYYIIVHKKDKLVLV